LIILVLIGFLIYFLWKKRKQNNSGSSPVVQDKPKPTGGQTSTVNSTKKAFAGQVFPRRSFREHLRDL